VVRENVWRAIASDLCIKFLPVRSPGILLNSDFNVRMKFFELVDGFLVSGLLICVPERVGKMDRPTLLRRSA
jgi:hypothetical protein